LFRIFVIDGRWHWESPARSGRELIRHRMGACNAIALALMDAMMDSGLSVRRLLSPGKCKRPSQSLLDFSLNFEILELDGDG
jgi:hypothetical protein